MKNKNLCLAIFERLAIGFCVGITISCAMSLFASMAVADGEFYFVAPALAAARGSALSAAETQFFVVGVSGAIFALLTFLYEIDRLSLLAQTALHFCAFTSVFFAMCKICHFLPTGATAILVYIAIFLAIYVAIWLASFFAYRNDVKKINEKIRSAK